jgi:hypothetical protein
VRLVYLDESGISDTATEPFIVVAGVIVNADEQWKALEAEHEKIRAEVVKRLPEEKQRLSFAFHGTELFSGGKTLERDHWSKTERWNILERLARIPLDMNVPIVMKAMGDSRLEGRIAEGDHCAFAIAYFCRSRH